MDQRALRDEARKRLSEAGPVVVLRRSYEEEPPSEAELAAIQQRVTEDATESGSETTPG